MSATALKQRLREDLKSAMQAKAADEMRVLRALIAALDNAEAVPPKRAPTCRAHSATRPPSARATSSTKTLWERCSWTRSRLGSRPRPITTGTGAPRTPPGCGQRRR